MSRKLLLSVLSQVMKYENNATTVERRQYWAYHRERLQFNARNTGWMQ